MIRNKRRPGLRRRPGKKTRNRTEDTCINGASFDDNEIKSVIDKKIACLDVTTQDPGPGDIVAKDVVSTQAVCIKTEGAVLREFINTLSKYSIQQIYKEYSDLKSMVFPEHTKVAFEQNMTKNRFKDIICCDQTRVVLHGEGDYIHANYVCNKIPSDKIICCQAPMESTVVEFWRMIVQEKIISITKLCQIMENNKPRCFQYWPVNVGQILQFGSVFVKHLNTEQSDPSYVLIKIQVIEELSKTNTAIEIINWIDWPDRFVPKNSTSLLKLLRKLQTYKGGIVIHCSAGIGRTGTVTALHIIMTKILMRQSFTIYEVVKVLRSQRPHSVQTDIQYLFVFKVIADYCLSRNIRTGDLQKFIQGYDMHLKTLNIPTE